MTTDGQKSSAFTGAGIGAFSATEGHGTTVPDNLSVHDVIDSWSGSEHLSYSLNETAVATATTCDTSTGDQPDRDLTVDCRLGLACRTGDGR